MKNTISEKLDPEIEGKEFQSLKSQKLDNVFKPVRKGKKIKKIKEKQSWYIRK